MKKPHFVETCRGSFFFGEYLYDQVVPQGHFQCQLKQIIMGAVHAEANPAV